jgi:hypothetical protein
MADQVADHQSELIRQFLADRTIGCPSCRYNLRGAAGNSCPECGVPLQLHLNTPSVRLGAWLVSVMSVAFPLGFSGILGATAICGALRAMQYGPSNGWYQPWNRFDTVTSTGLAVMTLFYSVVLVIVIRRRTRFLLRPRGEQWLRSISLGVVMLAIQVAMFSLWARLSQY